METVIDFRSIDRGARHAVFFTLFEALREGASFEFMNDHDPAPLYRQTQTMGLSNLEWSYSEKGPETWRIRVTKKTSVGASKEEGCCGICGGHGHQD